MDVQRPDGDEDDDGDDGGNYDDIYIDIMMMVLMVDIMMMVLIFANRSLGAVGWMFGGCSPQRRGSLVQVEGELPATPDTSTSYPPSFKSDGELPRCKCLCMYLHVFAYVQIYRIQYMQTSNPVKCDVMERRKREQFVQT